MERIPIPPRIWWREFSVSVLPPAVFAGGLAVVVWLWLSTPGSGVVPGLAEGLRSIVCSAQSGVLAHVLVEPFEVVKAGQPLAVVHPVDPRIHLGLLQTELDLARLRLEPSLAEQNALDYERLRVEWLRTRSELGIAEVRLHRSQRDVLRNTPLHEEQLVSDDMYELLLKTRDADLVEVQTKSNTVAALEQRLGELRSLGEPGAMPHQAGPEDLVRPLVALRDAAVTNLGPVTLVSPIDGVVSQIHRRPLEQVVEGDPLVTVQSPRSGYVVGYLRQPYPFDPAVGQRVRVTTRERRPREFASAISQVGAQLEIITNALAYVRQGALVDAGLPIIVPIPDGVHVRPGEMVDLRPDPDALDDSDPIWSPTPSNARVESSGSTRTLRSP